jgi:hypothetical protein
LADAGYWANAQIDSLRERGMIPIVAPDTTRNRPRKTRLGGAYDFMRRVVATERGDIDVAPLCDRTFVGSWRGPARRPAGRKH